jgi:acyl carrier protein
VESVTPHLSAHETSAWDSLAQLGMTAELQKQFGITLTNQESFRLRSMACLREVISKSRVRASR